MKNIKISWRKILLTMLVFFASAIVQVVGLNAFLIPNSIFSSGFNGIAQLLSIFSHHFFHVSLPTGTFIMIFNIPIGIVGWKMIGGKFTILSFANSIFVSVIQIVAPTQALTNDPLLASLFGGLLIGASIGVAMRYGFSTGGMDIVAMVVQKRTGKSIGVLMNVINFAVVIIAGSFIGWQSALFTIVGIYATGRVVDTLYTSYQKLTAMIVTSKGDEVVAELHKDLIRGITIIPSRGAYTKRDSTTLMMVLSRYELFEMQEVVHRIDPKAFINLMNTVSVSGEFLDADRQLQMKRAVAVPRIETVEAQIEAEQRLEEQLENIEDRK
ncbi:membrane protein [Leuconostoc litchii]|uniref:YitT family protein n=1 Tax=Leuconostoc litchii TaxID=1981069 RepID=A0A6P2CPH8_9LACO|nr:YitT family protein [Leuconostoc litchii]TYC47293.1 YitT family protein [Leuconostoc litchii]GMA69284.1 membrane protein [Leuconostoc litchii]